MSSSPGNLTTHESTQRTNQDKWSFSQATLLTESVLVGGTN
ncbi:hypothetical protein Pla52n_64210 [Stieleria varia]|uniref:Uncharacterized protein n=1 Tax=Stieleria varia TaxID=2528005 RepID=A0A5C5ZY53_9BACT|nr:hypothetical protein Pla52n_64210 [Stieleria varia]